MHLNLNDTVTRTCLTTAALHIKAESSFLIASLLGIYGRRKQVTDHVKHTGVSGRIGTWCPSDRGLVDVDDLIQLLHSLDALMFAWNGSGPV